MIRGQGRPYVLMAAAAGLALVLMLGAFFLAVRGRGAATAYALIDEPTLTVLRGQVEVQLPGGFFAQVSGDAVVRGGTKIRTGPDSYALVTYFDGSTTEIEPNTVIELQRLERVGRGQFVSLQQEIGQTWNRVERLIDPASRFEVRTASAVAFVRGTDFRVIVEVTQRTIVQAVAEEIVVEAAGMQVVVPPGFQTTVEPGQPPSPPVPIPPAPFALQIDAVGPASFWLTDNLSRGAGVHPEGGIGNQIPGTTLAGAENRQSMSIPDPAPNYELVLTGQGDGSVTVTVTGFAGGAPVGSRATGLGAVLNAEVSAQINRGGTLTGRFQFEGGRVSGLGLSSGGSPGGVHRRSRSATTAVSTSPDTPTLSPTITLSPTATGTPALTPEPTNTPTSTPAETPRPTQTPPPTTPPTVTPTPIPTEVPAQPTPVPTEVPAQPTTIPTEVPAQPTPEPEQPTPIPVPPASTPTATGFDGFYEGTQRQTCTFTGPGQLPQFPTPPSGVFFITVRGNQIVDHPSYTGLLATIPLDAAGNFSFTEDLSGLGVLGQYSFSGRFFRAAGDVLMEGSSTVALTVTEGGVTLGFRCEGSVSARRGGP